MARIKKSLAAAAEMDIDLKPFINFLIVLVPVLMLSAQFASISIVDIKIPEGRGSQTSYAVKEPPKEDESDKLLLTAIVTDSVVTIGAKGGFLPSLFYKEFHKYVSREDRKVETTIEYDPKNPKKAVINPKTNKPFDLNERQEILLYVCDENYAAIINSLYTKQNEMLMDVAGTPITKVNVGDTAYILDNPRRMTIVKNPADYTLKPRSAYDEMKNRLMKIKERYRDVSDADDIIIAAENNVAYDKIIQLMDVSRAAEFPKIAIAKLRS